MAEEARPVMNSVPAWICRCSVDVDVAVSFAWQYMRDVRNWGAPPAECGLEGRFAAGTGGTRKMPGQPTNSWIIRDVDPGRAYTIEGSSFLENAVLQVHWQFDSLREDRTRLTQRLELSGENADRYAEQVRSAFEPHLEPGMQRIARMMKDRASG